MTKSNLEDYICDLNLLAISLYGKEDRTMSTFIIVFLGLTFNIQTLILEEVNNGQHQYEAKS